MVKAAQFDFSATEEGVIQARAGLLPSVTFDANKTFNRQNVVESQNTAFDAGATKFINKEYTLTATQPIFNAVAWSRLSQSRSSVKQSFATKMAAEQDLILRVSSAYLGVLAAQDGVQFALTEKEAVARELELAEGKYKRGLGTVTGFYDAKARLALNEARTMEARNKLDDAKQALREITSNLVEDYRYLAADIPLVMPDGEDVEKWVKTALAQNFGIEAKRQAVEVARNEIDKQNAGHFPVVDLVASHNNKDTGSTLYGGGSVIETDEVMVRVSLPLFRSGSTAALVREATLRQMKAKEELEQEIRKVDRQTRSAYLGVLSSISKVNSLKESLVFQKSAAASREAGFKSGVYTIVAVLDAQRDLHAAKRDYAQARYDYLINRLRLKQAIGALGDDDLIMVNNLLVNVPDNEDLAWSETDMIKASKR